MVNSKSRIKSISMSIVKKKPIKNKKSKKIKLKKNQQTIIHLI